MKCIIAGGRDFVPTPDQANELMAFLIDHNVTEVVSGGAKGADAFGALVANGIGLPVKFFMAEWDLYGKAAGPIRNKSMAEYSDILRIYPGGRGTENMVTNMKRLNKPIFNWEPS